MTKEDFEREVTRSAEQLYRIAKSILISDADCEDAVSDAVLRAWNKRGSLRDERNFRAWLIRIVIRESYRLCKRRKQTAPLTDADLIAAAPQETYPDLYRAIARLPADLRITVELRDLEGYSVEETARLTGVRAVTVKKRHARALVSLRQMLEGYENE